MYDPTNKYSSWSIRSENTDIKGKLDIEKGNLKIERDAILHGYNNEVHQDEFREVRFKSNDINVKNSSKLSINRGAKVESNINIDKDASLEMLLLGTVKDIPKPYEGAKTEKEINETIIKGTINFKDDANINNFNAEIQNNNIATIESKIKGKISAIKKGEGLLHLKHENNSELKGNIDVEGGKLKVNKRETLGDTKTMLKNNSILEVENNNSDIVDLLDKIDKNSKGVLSLGKSISSIDAKYKDYNNLYLGSSKNITIGSYDKAIDSNIKTLNLGGDNGTITLRGLDKSNTVTKVNIGNGVSKGTVIIDNKNGKDINSEINVSKNSTVKFLNDTHLKSVENSGEISIKDKNMKIDKYVSKGGKFNIELSKMNKTLLEIDNADKDVDASVNLKEELLSKLIYNNKKLNVAKVKNNKLKISNLKEYDSVYELNEEKGSDDIVKLYSTIKADALNKIHMLNELDLINYMSNELKYRNIIEANYVNYTKIDKEHSKLNSTEYKNKINFNGIEINFEKSNDVDATKISGGFDFKVLGSSLTTDFKNNGKEPLTKIFVSVGAIPKLGLKYKFFDINLGLGLNTILVNNMSDKDILVYLNNSLNIGLSPKFKVSNNVGIRYLNRFGYKINYLLSEKIKNSVDNYPISHKKPISIYYETGFKLENKYVDFFSKANLEYNWSRYEISNKGQSIDNSFKDDWRINIKTGFEFKPTDRIYMNLDFDANLYQKSYGKYIFRLGTGYNW
ncbi:hypothetical protein [Streptobacillus ratti]|uniref:hypothetical protein n=1 Tax=Streptobacillus ratti TaxID=1720557 RepID=UPI001FC91A48|nr:hypothetical protein [Streptobacillus ratti]